MATRALQASATLLLLLCFAKSAAADKMFDITVTRVSDDLYAIDGTDLLVQTEHCYQYSYSQKAILSWKYKGSYSNKLNFLKRDGEVEQACKVARLLVETEP